MFKPAEPKPIYSVERFDEPSQKWRLVPLIAPSHKRAIAEKKAQKYREQSPDPVKTRIVRE